MKNFIALTLALVMLLSLVACGTNKNDANDTDNGTDTIVDTADDTVLDTDADTEADTNASYTNATELLTQIWNAHADEQKFAIMGGSATNMVMDAPGSIDLTNADDVATMTNNFLFPEASVSSLLNAATFMHAMNANTFSIGGYQFADEESATSTIEALKNAALNNRWMCGFPEQLVIITLPGNYVLCMFGVLDLVNNFIANTNATVTGATIVVNQGL